ncbi:hypothetical protein DRZ78_01660 [Candidatus Aerophobetes bacterium]|uniref:Uncharacterized protein n=1 Tax=Aerophobetes bacterium TaxID=2030807 RepID=A0A662D3J8_UNCAE|nr:MAG: hypothetical protein DRZ78_01660 [Candidatus Aerophobetes bacterium]
MEDRIFIEPRGKSVPRFSARVKVLHAGGREECFMIGHSGKVCARSKDGSFGYHGKWKPLSGWMAREVRERISRKWPVEPHNMVFVAEDDAELLVDLCLSNIS